MKMHFGNVYVSNGKGYRKTGLRIPERRILVLDDDIDMLENEYGCELTEVSEDNLYDIVYRLCGDTPVRVEYDSRFLAIFYEVEAEAS